jgi:hypothetical protein
MACQYLIGSYLRSCAASHDVYIPSAFEADEYCKRSRHTLCPLFRLRSARERLIDEWRRGCRDQAANCCERSRSPLQKA